MSTRDTDTTIRVKRETAEALAKCGSFHDSFDSVIKKLLNEKKEIAR
jgi:predicted CopG family antitoxin